MIRINLLQPRWQSQLKRWYVNGGPSKWFRMREKVFPSVGGVLTVCNEHNNYLPGYESEWGRTSFRTDGCSEEVCDDAQESHWIYRQEALLGQPVPTFDPIAIVRAHDTVKSSLGKGRQPEEKK